MNLHQQCICFVSTKKQIFPVLHQQTHLRVVLIQVALTALLRVEVVCVVGAVREGLAERIEEGLLGQLLGGVDLC